MLNATPWIPNQESSTHEGRLYVSFSFANYVIKSHLLILFCFESEQIFMNPQRFSHETGIISKRCDYQEADKQNQFDKKPTFHHVSHDLSLGWRLNVFRVTFNKEWRILSSHIIQPEQ